MSKQKDKIHQPLVYVPGMFVEITINISDYHPHTIYWISYLCEFLEGRSFSDIVKAPPWPYPVGNSQLYYQIIMELYEKKWIQINWEEGVISVNRDLKKIYNQGGTYALIDKYMSVKTISDEWWFDKILGSYLPKLTVFSYDYEFSKTYPSSMIKLDSKIPPPDLLKTIKFDLQNLLREKGIYDIHFSNIYLANYPKIAGNKEIVFELYKTKSSHLIPSKLFNLEATLLSEVPQLFEKWIPGRKRIEISDISNIEKFALVLEKFSLNVPFFPSKGLVNLWCDELQYYLDDEVVWETWYKNGLTLEIIAGQPESFFEYLSEMLNPNSQQKSDIPLKIIILSSFLNLNNLMNDEGLASIISTGSENIEILFLYGHSDDKPFTEFEFELAKYREKLFELIPIRFHQRISFDITTKKTHEKLVVCSDGNFMLSSWNTLSSNPFAQVFEVGVRGKEPEFCKKLMSRLSLYISPKNEQFKIKLIESLEHQIATQNLNPQIVKSLISNLRLSTQNLTQFFDNLEKLGTIERETVYSKVMTQVRADLYPFIRKSRVTMISEFDTRDLLFDQITKTHETLFLATDRITSSGFDKGLIALIKNRNLALKILWGREWEQNVKSNRSLGNEYKDQLKTVKALQSEFKGKIQTSNYPMENHAKFAIFDHSRLLITSDNLLKFGGEVVETDSNELGLFIENIILARDLVGKAILHQSEIFNQNLNQEVMSNLYDLICVGNEIYYSFKDSDQNTEFDFKNPKFIFSGIEISIEEDLKIADETDKHKFEVLNSKIKYIQNQINQPISEYVCSKGVSSYLLCQTQGNPSWIPYSDWYLEKFDRTELKIYVEPAQEVVEEKQQEIADRTHPIIIEIMQDMVEIKAGTFLMGNRSPKNMSNKKIQALSRKAKNLDFPQHQATITQNFLIGKFVVTQNLWEKVMGSIPGQIIGKFKGSRKPIIHISYKDMMRFFDKVNSLSGGGGFTLPTEAQWEYCCRAGSNTNYSFGNSHSDLNYYAWNKLNSKFQLQDVGLKKPNQWRLYDFHGLVYESVLDDLRKYNSKSQINPLGPMNSNICGARGGAWVRHPSPDYLKSNHFLSYHRELHSKDEKSYRASFRLVRVIENNKEVDKN